MNEKTLIKKTEKDRINHSAAKQLNKDKGANPCNSCGVCHRLRSPHLSSESASIALSQAKAMGKGSCAVSFMQKNHGNTYMQRVANQHMPSAIGHKPSAISHTPYTIGRKCSCGGSCSRCKGEEEAERVSMSIMRTPSKQYIAYSPHIAYSPLRSIADSSNLPSISHMPSAIRYKPSAISQSNEQSQIGEIMSNRGSGQRLDENTRSFMEQRFGHDFSHVRLHTDSYAARKSNELNAEAFTIGRDVFFNVGRYNPSSTEGKRLMAHELTHVVQQTVHTSRSIQKKIEVNPGLTLDMMGYTTSKSGNVYTCPRIVKSSIWHELFTSLLFSPRIFKLKGTTNPQINSSFRKHMQARSGILDFASKKKYIFGAGGAFRMNPAYWIVDSTGWRLKPGVDRTEAINDINVHPDKYAIACQAATLLTMIGGGKSNIVEGSSSDISDWIPGDWGYITNTSFPSGGPAGLEGENIIYTGKDKFWGHFGPGNEYKTLTEWFNQVKSWHGSASIESTRRIPDAGLE